MTGCPLCEAGGKTVHERAHQLLHAALELVSHPRKGDRDDIVKRMRSRYGDDFAREAITVANTTRAWIRNKDSDGNEGSKAPA